jgi:hypothetical protein
MGIRGGLEVSAALRALVHAGIESLAEGGRLADLEGLYTIGAGVTSWPAAIRIGLIVAFGLAACNISRQPAPTPVLSQPRTHPAKRTGG